MRKQSIQQVRHVHLQCDNLAFVNVLVHVLEADRFGYNDVGFVCMIVWFFNNPTSDDSLSAIFDYVKTLMKNVAVQINDAGLCTCVILGSDPLLCVDFFMASARFISPMTHNFHYIQA